MKNKPVYSLIVTLVNRGFSDEVMNAARNAGAKGGTIINAHGTNLGDEERFFGISIQPEKEIVLILTTDENRPVIMSEIVTHIGLGTAGAGITFSLPVTDVEGIKRITDLDEEDADND